MQTTKLVIGAGLLIAFATAVPVASADENYAETAISCGVDYQATAATPLCIVGLMSPDSERECSVAKSVAETEPGVLNEGDIADCANPLF